MLTIGDIMKLNWKSFGIGAIIGWIFSSKPPVPQGGGGGGGGGTPFFGVLMILGISLITICTIIGGILCYTGRTLARHEIVDITFGLRMGETTEEFERQCSAKGITPESSFKGEHLKIYKLSRTIDGNSVVSVVFVDVYMGHVWKSTVHLMDDDPFIRGFWKFMFGTTTAGLKSRYWLCSSEEEEGGDLENPSYYFEIGDKGVWAEVDSKAGSITFICPLYAPGSNDP
jgi:hypothetical protein